MADLYNLLDDVNENQEPEVEETQETNDNDDDIFQPEPELPPALREAGRKRRERRMIDDEETVEKEKLQDEEEEQYTEDPDYAQLKRLWTQEMSCPELLPFDAETVELQLELLQGQEESIDKLLQQQSTTRDRNNDPSLNSLIASIYKMDADRVRFMLTDLQRTRLAKLEEHPLYMREMLDRMSNKEIEYLKQYGELLERHFRRTVTDHIPKEAWKKLDEPEMIDKPDLDKFVFCKVIADTAEIDNHDPLGQDNEEEDGFGRDDDIQERHAGDLLIVRYSVIRELVLEGKIELLL